MKNRTSGFTLAELLIALAILGVIATFTIPKVLSAQQDGKYNAMAKETAAMLSAAFQSYVNANGLPAKVTTANLTPYMNYVSLPTSVTMDNYSCSGGTPCAVKLHNGAVISLDTGNRPMCTSSPLSALTVVFDPDGEANGKGSLTFFLYSNGRILDGANVIENTEMRNSSCSVLMTYTGVFYTTPDWFSWNK